VTTHKSAARERRIRADADPAVGKGTNRAGGRERDCEKREKKVDFALDGSKWPAVREETRE